MQEYVIMENVTIMISS